MSGCIFVSVPLLRLFGSVGLHQRTLNRHGRTRGSFLRSFSARGEPSCTNAFILPCRYGSLIRPCYASCPLAKAFCHHPTAGPVVSRHCAATCKCMDVVDKTKGDTPIEVNKQTLAAYQTSAIDPVSAKVYSDTNSGPGKMPAKLREIGFNAVKVSFMLSNTIAVRRLSAFFPNAGGYANGCGIPALKGSIAMRFPWVASPNKMAFWHLYAAAEMMGSFHLSPSDAMAAAASLPPFLRSSVPASLAPPTQRRL